MSSSLCSTGRAFIVMKRWPFSASAATAAACIFEASRISFTVKTYSRAGCATTTPTRTSPSIAATASSRASPAASSSSASSSHVQSCAGS